jgi:class 3 adenylate cyclase/tetratricopeptide (TPR) repeat protein
LAPGVKFCGECGVRVGVDASPEQRTAEPGTGERRQLTVLFCDLVGSTELSSILDPEDLREVVRAYQGAAGGAVGRFGGHVAQYLGDGILAYFGYPQAHDDDAERALRAGLAAIEGVRALRERLGRALAVRVGVHTGPVVVGEMGAGARRETLALGETTNVAARLEAAAAPDTVVASGTTLRLARGIFVTEDLGGLTLKGMPEPVPAHRVVQPSGVRSRLDVAAGHLTRFVGREVELATLVERWERAADGEGQNVLIVGEAGVGKSRLAYQLRERLATTPHTWLECGATPYTEGTPFHPMMALVAQGLAFTPADTTAEKVGKIERGLRELASSENVALLADFLGLPPQTPLALNPDVQRRRTMELLAQWNLALSTIQPLVLLVEDLHWCDASSLELLGRIVAQSATARACFVATARPEFTPPWPARSNLTTLQLARLTKRQAREMVTALVGETMPAETLEALVARADGVPLYVEELTKAVAEPGAARGADAIPTTLAGSLMARLDRLSTAKEVAQRAAVLGREFRYRLLASIAGRDEGTLCEDLERLVEAEILFVRGVAPHATYTFKHALVQEAAYGSLLKRTRQQLHGAVLDALVGRFLNLVATEPEVAARHAEAAGRFEEAITHYGSAGQRAQARSAHQEAIVQLSKAIMLLGTRSGMAPEAREVMLRLALGASLAAIRGYAHAETEAAYERAAAIAGETGDARGLGLARTGLSFCYTSRGEPERSRKIAAEVIAAAEANGDRELAVAGHVHISNPECFQGRFRSSLAHTKRVIDLYDPTKHHALVGQLTGDPGASAFSWAAWNLWYLGYADEAVAHAQEGVKLARRLGHPFTVAFTLFWEAAVHWNRRDFAAVLERTEEVLTLGEGNQLPFMLGFGRIFHGGARVMTGALSALGEMHEGFTLVAETGTQGGAPGVLSLFAEAQRSAGRTTEAAGTVATALVLAEQTGQHYCDADLHRLDGDLLLTTGGPADEATARYHQALAIAREQGARSFELRAATSLARLRRDQGQRAEARALLAPVYATFTEGFTTRDLLDAKALLDELT